MNRTAVIKDGKAFVTTEINLEQARQKIVENIVVDDNGCWRWQAAKIHGYGTVSINRLFFRTHRLSYMAFKGEFPADNFVLHACDVRDCCNPDHLSLGSHDDNMQDQVDRGRTARGDKNPNTRITAEQVLEIRRDVGTLHTELAKRYGVSQTLVTQIRKGKVWKYLEMPDSMHIKPDRGIKLTAEKALFVKRNLHMTNKQLSEILGVDRSCISRIRTGHNWKHVNA